MTAQETNTPNNRAPRYMKQQLTELKGEIDRSNCCEISVSYF